MNVINVQEIGIQLRSNLFRCDKPGVTNAEYLVKAYGIGTDQMYLYSPHTHKPPLGFEPGTCLVTDVVSYTEVLLLRIDPFSPAPTSYINTSQKESPH